MMSTSNSTNMTRATRYSNTSYGYLSDAQAAFSQPTPTITLDGRVTDDDIVSDAESRGIVAIRGTVTNAKAGDEVNVIVNSKLFSGHVDANGTSFTVNVYGGDLVADNDRTIQAIVTTYDSTGKRYTARTTDTYWVSNGSTQPSSQPTQPSRPTFDQPSITLDPNITADDKITYFEAGSTIAITGRVSGVKVGDTVYVRVNGKSYNGSVKSDNTFSINVNGGDLVADSSRTITATVYTVKADGSVASADDTETYQVDLSAPGAPSTPSTPSTPTFSRPSITLDPNITADDKITYFEVGSTIAITGRVSGVKVGDTVYVRVNGKSYNGSVKSDNTFSIDVAGSDLVADSSRTVTATVYTVKADGSVVSADDTETYQVDLSEGVPVPPVSQPSITLDSNITADDKITAAEAGKNVAITGRVSGVKVGDTVYVRVNGKYYNGSVKSDNTFSIDVAGSDLVADSSRTVSATVYTVRANGSVASADDTETYLVDLSEPTVPTPTWGQPSITLDSNITADDTIDLEELSKNIAVTGRVSGVNVGDTVYVRVNSKYYTGLVKSDNTFSIDVLGRDLASDRSRTISATVYTRRNGQTLRADDTETYQVDLSHTSTPTPTPVQPVTPPSQPITPSQPTISQAAAISITNVAGDGVVSLKETNGNVTISGSVSGVAKQGDVVNLNINNRSYRATVDSRKNFSVNVAGSELAADADHTIEAQLTTRDNSGNALTVSHSHQYASVKNVSGEDVGDQGQSEVAYFIRSIATDSRQGYLNSKDTRYRDAQGNIKNGAWDGKGHGIEVSYSFATRAYGGESGFKQYSETKKAAVREALGEYERYANIRFREVDDDGKAHFRFYLDNLSDKGNRSLSEGTPSSPTAQNMCTCCGGLHRTNSLDKPATSFGDPQFAGVTAGYAYYGGDVHLHSQLYASDNALNSTTKTVRWGLRRFKGGYGTLVHEIGHSLGLKHTGNYNGSNGFAPGPFLPTGEENSAHSIMSYNHSNAMRGPGLQIFDLAAIHYRYGVNRNQNAGNNTYTFREFNSNTVGHDVYIWDGDGVDTFDASAEKQGVTVDLTPGSWNYSGQKSTNFLTEANRTKTKGQSFIGYGTQIENLIGSEYSDTLTGNAADNNIYGGAGNDRISGGAGNDTLDGGAGDDTYVFSGRFGKDVVLNSGGGNDTIFFEKNSGVSHYAVTKSYEGVLRKGNDLVLMSHNPNSVTVKDYFSSTNSVKTITFESGGSLTEAQINSLIGAANNMVNAMASFSTVSATAGDLSASVSNNNQPLLASSALGA